MSARRRHQNAPAQPINNASPYSTAKAHIYKPKDQQSIWLEKVGEAVSLTYYDNIKRIYRNIAKKMPQCFACIRGGWGYTDRIVLLANSELWLGCFTMNTMNNTSLIDNFIRAGLARLVAQGVHRRSRCRIEHFQAQRLGNNERISGVTRNDRNPTIQEIVRSRPPSWNSR